MTVYSLGSRIKIIYDVLVHHKIDLSIYVYQFIFKLLYLLSLISKSSKDHCPVTGHSGIPLLVGDDNFKDSV